MSKKIFYQIFRATLVGMTLLTLLAFAPGGAHNAKAQDGPVMPPNDERALPKSITLQREASQLALATALPLSNAPGYNDTSTYMLGSVAVGIILPESAGSDENWEYGIPGRQIQVVDEIKEGLNWWKDQGGILTNLSFQYDVQLGIPTNYEPIARSSSSADEGDWINEVMAELGYNNGNHFDKVYAYVNDLRTRYNTDWAFAIFVVDSFMDLDGAFTDDYFAYAYLSGPFMVMTYDNASWSIDNMNWVTAHEMGHIFMAGDQYYQPGYGGCISTTKRYGYLGVVNANCEYNNPGSAPSIMRDNTDALDVYARGQIGWRDSDSDGIPDPMDTTPAVNLSQHSPNPTSETTLLYSGHVTDSPYPHAICDTGDRCYNKDVTIQAIDNVEYRLDNGVWNSAVSSDGSFDSDVEGFSFNGILPSPGTYPVQVRSSNRVGNVSTTWNDTVMTNERTAAPVGTGIYDDAHPAWVYSGNWTAYSGSGPYNNTLHYSTTLTDSATLSFQGSQFILTYTGFTNRGQVQVYVDDFLVPVGTIDQYSPSLAWQKTWVSPILTAGTHTLKLVHATGTHADIDAIQILAPLPPGKYDDTHSRWFYNGNWAAYSGGGPYINTLHYSATINDYATLSFQGNQFILTYTGHTNRGQVEVYVDNVPVGTIDQYSPSLAWQKTWASPILTAGIHTLKLVHANGTYVDIDAIEILQTTLLGNGTYDDTDTGWIYSGNWVAGTFSGPYNNTLHYSATIGNYATLAFQGDQFILTHTGHINRGNLDVYIDTFKVGTLNEYNPTLVWQKTATGPTVTLGTHFLKLVHASGTYVDIDAIQIIGPPDITPPAAIDDLQVVTGTAKGSVDLSWTAVGDDDKTGTASSYLVRYRTDSAISSANWDDITTKTVTTGIPTPQASGQPETMTVFGLTAGTYYFAVRARDEVPNIGAVSTCLPPNTNCSAEAFDPDPPLNDNINYATANPITSMPYTDTQDYFYAATTEPGDPPIVTCNSDEGVFSIWYAYTPSSDGILTVDTYGTNLAYDTVLAVWTFDESAFTHVACNDNANESTFLSQAVAYLYKDTTYYIEVVQFTEDPNKNPSAPNQSPAAPVDEVVLNASFSPAPLKSLGKHDDTDPGWIYSGDWFTYTGSGPYNNTLHNSTTLNDYATLAFEGARFKLTYTGYSNRGNLDVYVDNAKVGSINQYNPSLAWQKTWASPVFADGVHTLKLVHASGTHADIDAIEIIPVIPLGPGTYDDTHADWDYSGNWTAYTSSGPYNNTLHYSTTLNDFATLSFQGSQFRLTYTGFINRGQVQVYVDDVNVGMIDQYSPSLAWQKTWTSPIFTVGTHSLKLVHVTGTHADIDAIQILAPLPPGKYDDTYPDWTYSGNWTIYTGSGPYNNTLHYSATIDDYAMLAFEGPQFILTYTKYLNRGNLDIFVDGAYVDTLDEFSSFMIWQNTWTSPTFSNGVHNLKLVHAPGGAGGTLADIDAIQILGPLPPGKYDDTQSKWVYNGNWAAYSGSGPYNNTLHYSATIDDYATLDFVGTQFILTYTGNTNRGQVKVYVDDFLVPVGTIDQYSPSLAWQKTWTSPIFTADIHSLKLVHTTGTFADIDAIQIITSP